MRTAHWLLAVALSVAGSASAGAGDPQSARQDAERQIRASLVRWTEAANRGDWKTALEVWAPDLVGWAPAGADDTYARESDGAAKSKPGPPATTYELKIEEVLVDQTMAVVRDVWTMTTRSTEGTARKERFRSFEVWRLQPDGQWKIARWIDGPITPLPS